MDEGPRRYAAFLSYSHKDVAAARAVHRKLEAYRIPRRIVGTEGERGPVPARLVPIFRDRDELPAAGDLSEKVRAALAASDCLVILCSPAAAASLWVAKEIDTFRALHPDRPIIAAILNGEPAEAFPSNLATGGAEPLAADLRPGRDGKRLGLLKLVAGLSGVGLDALVQRDAQRRLRRVTAVTAVALAAVLAMAVLTVVAIAARQEAQRQSDEAQRQRAEAEGLVEFMLTDLRDRLRKVGRLDIMEAVNARSLLYHRGKRELLGSADDLLLQQARILQARGEDELEKGDWQGALITFRKASNITRLEARRNPSDLQVAVLDGRSENGLGRVDEARDNWDGAKSHYGRFADAAAPAAASALADVAAATVNLGKVENSRKNYAAAEPMFARAAELLHLANLLRPDYWHTLLAEADAEAWLADTYYRRGLWPRSLAARRRQHALLKMSPMDANNADAIFRLAAGERGLGCSLWKIGRRAEAATRLRRAYEIADALSKKDGENGSWRLLKAKLSDDLLNGGVRGPANVRATALRDGLQGDAEGCTAVHRRGSGAAGGGRRTWTRRIER